MMMETYQSTTCGATTTTTKTTRTRRLRTARKRRRKGRGHGPESGRGQGLGNGHPARRRRKSHAVPVHQVLLVHAAGAARRRGKVESQGRRLLQAGQGQGPGVEGRAEARRRVSGHVARGHHPPPRRPPRPLPAHPRGTGQGRRDANGSTCSAASLLLLLPNKQLNQK